MCINSQNIVCFFSDVVNTCVVYIEQATAGRGGGGSAAIYHRLYVRSDNVSHPFVSSLPYATYFKQRLHVSFSSFYSSYVCNRRLHISNRGRTSSDGKSA